MKCSPRWWTVPLVQIETNYGYQFVIFNIFEKLYQFQGACPVIPLAKILLSSFETTHSIYLSTSKCSWANFGLRNETTLFLFRRFLSALFRFICVHDISCIIEKYFWIKYAIRTRYDVLHRENWTRSVKRNKDPCISYFTYLTRWCLWPDSFPVCIFDASGTNVGPTNELSGVFGP